MVLGRTGLSRKCRWSLKCTYFFTQGQLRDASNAIMLPRVQRVDSLHREGKHGRRLSGCISPRGSFRRSDDPKLRVEKQDETHQQTIKVMDGDPAQKSIFATASCYTSSAFKPLPSAEWVVTPWVLTNHAVRGLGTKSAEGIARHQRSDQALAGRAGSARIDRSCAKSVHVSSSIAFKVCQVSMCVCVPPWTKGLTPPLFHRQGGSGPLSLTAQRRQ